MALNMALITYNLNGFVVRRHCVESIFDFTLAIYWLHILVIRVLSVNNKSTAGWSRPVVPEPNLVPWAKIFVNILY